MVLWSFIERNTIATSCMFHTSTSYSSLLIVLMLLMNIWFIPCHFSDVIDFHLPLTGMVLNRPFNSSCDVIILYKYYVLGWDGSADSLLPTSLIILFCFRDYYCSITNVCILFLFWCFEYARDCTFRNLMSIQILFMLYISISTGKQETY